jgi:HD-GYP domain-containing protein (c-di-GMP phosphodiesterase class II)
MDSRPPSPDVTSSTPVDTENVSVATEGRLAQLSTLMQDWETAEGDSPPSVIESPEVIDRLAEARLGIASSLFTALRWKHEPTAQHCLRVALSCSGWADLMGLPTDLRDDLELAALLHDVGKIGILDAILCKPGVLNVQETTIMDCHWLMGEQILRGSCAAESVIDTIRYSRGWFDGTRGNCDRRGDDLPLSARMLHVVDAFDSMTSDKAYRRAMSVQRAFDELFRCAGKQFDPDLVTVFSKLFEKDPLAMQQRASTRWLAGLQPEAINNQWRRNEVAASPVVAAVSGEVMFRQKLVDNMHDGVIFIDASRKVTYWNRGTERLTGISGKGMQQRIFTPSLLQLRDEQDKPIADGDCPVETALRSGVQWLRRCMWPDATAEPWRSTFRRRRCSTRRAWSSV